MFQTINEKRATFIIRDDQLKLLKSLAYYDRKPLKCIIQDAIDLYTSTRGDIKEVSELYDITIKNEDVELNNKLTLLLDHVYKRFPVIKRIGKNKAFEKVRSQVKTLDQAKDFQKACNNYFHYVEDNNFEEKYIKQFKVFINQWKDFIDYGK